MKVFSNSRIFCSIFCLFLIAGCSKREAFVYPTKYYPQYGDYFLTHFQPYRLFANTGEITDPMLLQQYAQRFAQYFYSPGSAFTDEAYKHFTVLNTDSLWNTGIAPVVDLRRTYTGLYDIFASNRLVPVNDTNALFLHMGQYKLHTLATTPLGYTYAELQSPAFVLKKVNDTLFLPMIRYIITSQRDNTFSFTSDKLNNVFDPASVNRLKAYDTLLLQSFDIGLRKIN